MHDAKLVHLEVDFTRLHVRHSLSNFHCHGTRLRVWHEATWTEYTAQRTHLAHDLGSGNDYIHIGPSALDLRHVFVQPNVVGTGVFCLLLFVRSAEHQYTYVLACPVREAHRSTNHLVGFGGRALLHEGRGFFQAVELFRIDFFSDRFLVLC